MFWEKHGKTWKNMEKNVYCLPTFCGLKISRGQAQLDPLQLGWG